MEQEPACTLQNAENDPIMAAASDALEGILDTIDSQNAPLPSSSATDQTHFQVGDTNQRLPDSECTPEECNEEAEPQTSTQQKLVVSTDESNSNISQGEASLSMSLPHEGARWTRIRKQIAGLPNFTEYLKWTEEDSSWSIDEAFASFCLDRVEESLSVPKQRESTTQVKKKGTRRKGQPKKYERKATASSEDNPQRPLRKRRGQENGLKMIEDDADLEEEDEDLLAMDDNPKDLDYQPLPMIRYPKRRRKSLPRAISSYQGQPKTPNRPKQPAKSTTLPQKTPAPKKAAKTPAKTSKLETYGPPRKRGRPKKAASESKKKFPKARVKPEKPAKTYIRMEVRLQRLPKMYECKMCYEQFPEAEEIKNHFVSTHQRDRHPVSPQNNTNESIEGENPNPGQSQFGKLPLPDITTVASVVRQCPKCKKYVENMTVHKREHQERNFICEECGKGFTENQILQKHKKVHEMDRTGDRFKCPVCDKSYRFSQNLRSHMLYHGGEKTFICDHCGKSFYTNNRLIIHSAIHMKEKPFKCSECGRGFSQKSNMQKHERVHTGVKPYQCDLCKESFNHKVSLKNHKKKHHGIDWWKEAGRPKPGTNRKSKDSPQTGIVSPDEPVPIRGEANPVGQEKGQLVTEDQWKSNDMGVQRDNNAGNQWRDDRQPVREAEATGSPWHRSENLNLEQQNQAAAEEAVRLQTLHQAGNQWKGNSMPLDRQGQAGDQGMTAFYYPSTYIQGYPSGYSTMPVVPINPEATVHPATRPSYQ